MKQNEQDTTKTVSMEESYTREPYFGGTHNGWTVRIIEDGKIVSWKTFSLSQRSEARKLAKQYRNSGYAWEYNSREHYNIDIEAGE